MRVLVVDDSSTMRRIIINTLRKLGYEDTCEAGDGRDLAKIPVLMVTTQAAKEDVIVAMRAGVNDYLIKPFTPDALKDKLLTLLAKE